jgi:hypothetical protein
MLSLYAYKNSVYIKELISNDEENGLIFTQTSQCLLAKHLIVF